jgi:hypothetical protein
MLDSALGMEGGVAGTLAGEKQTQIAACLAAILHLLLHSQGDVTLKPDCNYAVEGLKAVLRGHCPRHGAHAHT